MSIHGVCFDEGQSGNCGLECKGLADNECTIEDEILINYSFSDIYDNGGFDEYLINKFVPLMTQEVISQQTGLDYYIFDHLKKLRGRYE